MLPPAAFASTIKQARRLGGLTGFVHGTSAVNDSTIAGNMRALRTVGVPYTDAQIASAAEEVKGKTELDATIAYLQVLGTMVDFTNPANEKLQQ